MSLWNVRLEVSNVGGRVIPMDRASINVAISTLTDKVAEISEAHWRLSVSDCGRYELRLAVERFHIRLPDRDGGGNSHVGLSVKVGLIESKNKVSCCVCDRLLG